MLCTHGETLYQHGPGLLLVDLIGWAYVKEAKQRVSVLRRHGDSHCLGAGPKKGSSFHFQLFIPELDLLVIIQ
jgi:hypothetical protein